MKIKLKGGPADGQVYDIPHGTNVWKVVELPQVELTRTNVPAKVQRPLEHVYIRSLINPGSFTYAGPGR